MKGNGEDDSFLLPNEINTCEKKDFIGGDVRVNENPGLQGMHTVFVREHNRIAKAIKSLAWQKSDEEIFYEVSRKKGLKRNRFEVFFSGTPKEKLQLVLFSFQN